MDYFDLGDHRRAISTQSGEAQAWFDRGLNWCFGFNHDEAIVCFERALACDPGCAMVHWGIAYAAGPFYNLTWREMGAAEAGRAARLGFEHARIARDLAAGASEVERRLIAAIGWRYQQPRAVSPDEFDRWDAHYALEMRGVFEAFPDDHDVMALLVEALIMRNVRRLWDLKTGAPNADSHVLEALDLCERSIAISDRAGVQPHPAICHLHIHILEMSTTPERAMRSADLLGSMCPDAGHMNHMPGHIYVACGRYEAAKFASEKAVRANDLYLSTVQDPGYYLLGCCHDLHLMMFTCMFLGQYEPAIWAADRVRELATRDVVSAADRPKLAQTVEGYHAMKTHVWVRFGRWQDIIDEPYVDEPEVYVLTAAMQFYAKGVAHATLLDFAGAERERDRFHQHLAQIPPDRRFLSNPTLASLAVGAAMLDGELAYHRGDHAVAYDHLRRAVQLDDNLSYTEPWAWMHPPRHALGALLLDQGHRMEAEQVYRDDLGLNDRVQRCAQHPENVWALHGLVECLKDQGETEELARLRTSLSLALAKADVPIESSCLCRKHRPAHDGCCPRNPAG